MHRAAPTDEELTNARAEGYLTGLTPGANASDCPYSEADLVLRVEWLDGFHDGWTVATKPGTPPQG